VLAQAKKMRANWESRGQPGSRTFNNKTWNRSEKNSEKSNQNFNRSDTNFQEVIQKAVQEALLVEKQNQIK
jgi:hypothetical protein